MPVHVTPPWSYALTLLLVALVLSGRVAMQTDDLRTALNVLFLAFCVPALTYGVVRGVTVAQDRTRGLLGRMDRLLELRAPERHDDDDTHGRA